MPTTKKAGVETNGAAPAEREINLDEARAARAEANETPVTLRIAGRTFTLPAEMPADFALMAQQGQMREAVVALFEGEDAEAFFALRPSVNDITALAEIAGKVYGITPGEAPASPAS